VDRGFASFFGFRASTDIAPYFYIRGDRAVVPPTATIAESRSHPSLGWSAVQGDYWKGGGIAPDLELKDVLPRFTAEAVTVIEEHVKTRPTQPFFLYFAPTAPHTPWLPSPEFQGRSQAGRYGDFAMMVDAMIGRLLRALDDTRQAANTLVIFTSDNGPVWYPADTRRTGHDATGGFRGMKGSSWEAGHRMPFIVRWPGKTKAGGTTAQMICFTDVLATLAAMVDRPLPADAGPDSFSFLSTLLGQPHERERPRQHLLVNQSFRSGPWKWIEGRERLEWAKPESGHYPAKDQPAGQLYHLDDDPHETRNLAAAFPERVAALKAAHAELLRGHRSRP
jgi:arylsulfatase A-like enzyme